MAEHLKQIIEYDCPIINKKTYITIKISRIANIKEVKTGFICDQRHNCGVLKQPTVEAQKAYCPYNIIFKTRG